MRSYGPSCRWLLPHYPDIKIEIIIDYGLTNILRASRLLLPRSGLERSDFVLWPDPDDLHLAEAAGETLGVRADPRCGFAALITKRAQVCYFGSAAG
jgi:hypothetical protein